MRKRARESRPHALARRRESRRPPPSGSGGAGARRHACLRGWRNLRGPRRRGGRLFCAAAHPRQTGGGRRGRAQPAGRPPQDCSPFESTGARGHSSTRTRGARSGRRARRRRARRVSPSQSLVGHDPGGATSMTVERCSATVNAVLRCSPFGRCSTERRTLACGQEPGAAQRRTSTGCSP